MVFSENINRMNFANTIKTVLIAIGLTACNAPVTDFVKGAKPGNLTPTPSTVTANNGPMALKVSPGKLDATAADLAVIGNVTATNRKLSGGGISMQITLSRGRVTP
jgi:hypothetical protein